MKGPSLEPLFKLLKGSCIGGSIMGFLRRGGTPSLGV